MFAKRQLGFKPPFEELRSAYYREMRKFVSLPNAFKGFGNEAVFAKMSNRNGTSLIRVYENGEKLFLKLEKLRVGFELLRAVTL